MLAHYNIVAAAAVDREFWCIHASFELTLKGPGMLWGLHCAPCVSLWGTYAVSLGHLGRSWGYIGVSWECLGTALGMPWDFSGPHWKKSVRGNPHRKPMALKYRACAQKIDPLEFACRSRRSRRNGPQTTVQDLPSTRAGDQDDVSFTNSLKLLFNLFSFFLNGGKGEGIPL